MAEGETTVGEFWPREVERLRKIVERLGSSEAFTHSQIIPEGPIADEMRARMQFARDALSSAQGKNP